MNSDDFTEYLKIISKGQIPVVWSTQYLIDAPKPEFLADDRIKVNLPMDDWDTFVKKEVSLLPLPEEEEKCTWAHSISTYYDIKGCRCYKVKDTKSGLYVTISERKLFMDMAKETGIFAVVGNKDIYHKLMQLVEEKLREAYNALR